MPQPLLPIAPVAPRGPLASLGIGLQGGPGGGVEVNFNRYDF